MKMLREPVHKGSAFLISCQNDNQVRDLILVLHGVSFDLLKKMTAKIRVIICSDHPEWKLITASIKDASFPHENHDIDPGYFCFDIRFFYSVASDGEVIIYEALLGRVIKRLLSNITGTDFIQTSGIARDQRYFDRPKARSELLREAKSNRWLLLEAIRRFGKTSFMINLEDKQPKDCSAVYVPLESGTSNVFFAHALLSYAIANDKMKSLLPKRWRAGIQASWTAFEILEKSLSYERDVKKDLKYLWKALSKIKTPILFMVDEMVIYLNNVFQTIVHGSNNLETYKAWVREVFEVMNEAPNTVHYVVAGSMHLPVFLEAKEIKIEPLDNMKSISLFPVPLEDIETLIRLSLLQGKTIPEPKEVKWIIDKFGGWIPSFLIYFLELLEMECRDRGKLNLSDIQVVYNSLFNAKNRYLFSDLDDQPRRYQEFFEPESYFAYRLKSLLVYAAQNKPSLPELERAFNQAKPYVDSISQGKKNLWFNLAKKIAMQDFSLDIQNDHCKIACPLLEDWILSRRHEWEAK